MDPINPKFIERYQLLYQKDPTSKLFAPLAEAYRKMGMANEALRLCEDGVRRHPHFPGGRVALAKVLIDRKDFDKASSHLKTAVELSPENILAHALLAECLMESRMPKEALRAFKMVLFLNPNDEKAQKAVKKLESLTADEYDDEIFELRRLPLAIASLDDDEDEAKPSAKSALARQRSLDRILSLSDAYIVRNDIERALATLEDAENELGMHPEIQKRRGLLNARNALATETNLEITKDIGIQPRRHDRMSKLEKLLKRIEERRHP